MLKRIAVRLREWLGRRHLAWHLALLGVVLCAPSLWLGLQMDDYIHRAALVGGTGFTELSNSPADLFAFITGDREANRRAVAAGFNPWWAHEDLRLAFFRPMTGLTHWLDYKLWPQWPALMHLQSLAWFAAVVVAATLLYRRMLRPAWVAGLAALLFAVDDAHGLPVLWLANRNATIGVLFGLLTLLAHDRWRGDGWRPGALLAPPLLLLGLLSNEGALATAAYLFAYALFLDRGTWRGRLLSLMPCALVCVAWLVAYRQMGYGAVGSGMYIDPGATPLRFLRAAAERAPVLLLGQWLIASDLRFSMSLSSAHAMWFVALGFLSALAVILAPLVKRDAVARFWLTGMLLSVPVFLHGLSDRSSALLRRHRWHGPARAAHRRRPGACRLAADVGVVAPLGADALLRLYRRAPRGSPRSSDDGYRVHQDAWRSAVTRRRQPPERSRGEQPDGADRQHAHALRIDLRTAAARDQRPADSRSYLRARLPASTRRRFAGRTHARCSSGPPADSSPHRAAPSRAARHNSPGGGRPMAFRRLIASSATRRR